MRDIDLFQMALGLSKPWYVERSEFDPAARRLDLYLDFESGGAFVCPECERAGCKAYDTTEKTWRHLNFFQHEAYLHARVPRVKCGQCGIKLVDVPWARAGSGFTLMFEAIVLMLVKSMPVAEVARTLNEHDTRLWRIVHHYIDQVVAERDFSEVRSVGMDETASKRGHNYITLFMDLKERQLLFATEGRDARTLSAFRADLEKHGATAGQIEEFCADLSPAFQKGLREEFPNARITFDKFHVMKLLNEAVDQVRREEQKSRPELKGTRYLWIRNPLTLSATQIAQYDRLYLPSLNLKTARAYHLKLAFQEIWQLPQAQAESHLKAWYDWAIRSKLEPMKRFARTIRGHWHGVLNWFQSGISNGMLEGLNSLIQAAKSKARGYRSTRNLIAMAYLIGGRLKLATLPM